MKRLRWGILGAGGIAKAFANGVKHSRTGEVRAVASREAAKASAFAEAHGIPVAHGSYEALLADSTVDAVYIATPHPMHAAWAIRCAEAGKHILCEKPIALNAHDTLAIVEAARRHDVFLMEAFMYRCNALTVRLVELLRGKPVGGVRLIRASFGFRAGWNPEGRLLNPDLGGGGILDVGCYAVSMSRLVAGVALDLEGPAEPVSVAGGGFRGETGVDEQAAAVLTFPGGILAEVSTGVRVALDSGVTIFGDEGRIEVPHPWFGTGREGGKAVIRVLRSGAEPEEIVVESTEWLYGTEADHVADNLARRQGVFPAMSWDDTIGNMRVLDQWRASFGLVYPQERPENMLRPAHGRPLQRQANAPMRHARIPGVDKDISRLIMGVDNQRDLRQGALVFDDYFELGGNTFDTAYVYTKCEDTLGLWVRNRGVRDDVVIITKGAHTPHCFPDKLTEELLQSLDRLQMDGVDLYFMHRDNPDVPVGEFVDVLNEHADAGRIGVFGGSNWSLERVAEANAYAARTGRRGFGAVSNNLSLARMVDAPWKGCVSCSDPASRSWLEANQMPLFPWSSQARGFFVPTRAHPDKRDDADLVRCWYSDDNFERQRRAVELAAKKCVEPINIALAYVLHQPFPTFCMVGPRQPSEMWSSLAALGVELTSAECRWLNLET